MFISKSLSNVGIVCGLAVLLAAGCGDKSEDKELTARIVAQLEAQKTPEQREAEAKQAAEEAAATAKRNALTARMVAEVRAVRAAMKNPKSFELGSIIHIDKSGINCIEYRGTNSFNAVVPEYVAFAPDGKAANWNKSCANQSGMDWVDRIKPLI
ncbi:hypothetical protein [Comamonas testosteroni]|uniref:hypothetical protein n=1 Tax=Comamonas testosteroni TaxID=285 RepID=UPI0005B32A31|nr:hypothetical protein [Comamonas testosteroni]